jgi:hypothetical protein
MPRAQNDQEQIADHRDEEGRVEDLGRIVDQHPADQGQDSATDDGGA